MSNGSNGRFRHRKISFAPVSNSALQDFRLSLKAKGLYAIIQSYINIPDFDLYKRHLMKLCREGEKAFDSAWKELKETGYLKQYRIPSGDNDTFQYEYELLEEADETRPSLINLSKNREVIPPKQTSKEKAGQCPNPHTPQKGVYANSVVIPTDSHTPHFAPYANGTVCEAHPVPKGGYINNTDLNYTDLNYIKSISQSEDTDRLTDFREKLRKQIEYDYFEENFPDDLSGIDVLIDCMAEMLISPTTKINGVPQNRETLKPYIEKADASTVRDFLERMRGHPTKGIKNITAYWRSSFINYLRDQEIVKLTL